MGRRARPVELLLLNNRKHLTKGEIAGRREAEDELRPPSGALRAPRWLDKAARKEWRRVVRLLAGLGVLTAADVNTLAVYCDAVVRYSDAAGVVQEQGTVVDTDRGPIQNPAVLVAEKYWRIMNRAAAALGLDPSSRAALAKARATRQREDKFEEMFGARPEGKRSAGGF